MKYLLSANFFLFPLVIHAQPDLSQPFRDCRVDGSITLYHLESNSWVFSDSSDAQRETLPASTFKVLNSAIALETGIVASKNEILKWDGTVNTFFGTPIDAWNRDSDMETAFKASSIWFYKELAEKIGRGRYRHWLESVSYGNDNLSEPGDDFWNFGTFGVSPLNQITFLKAFYLEELPFSATTYQVVKNLMLSETGEVFTLYGKTGWTKTETENIAWWIGYVESRNGTWFFATRIIGSLSDENPEFSACRMKITRSVLEEFDVFD